MPKHSLNRYVCCVAATPEQDKAQARVQLRLDQQQRLPGRGFYFCNDAECQKRKDRYQGWRRKCKGVVKV